MAWARPRCDSALARVEAALAGGGEAARRTAAYLGQWRARGPAGGTPGPFARRRWPGAATALELSEACTCADGRCPARRQEAWVAEAPVVLAEAPLALTWAARGPLAWLALGAEELPAEEQRRARVVVGASRDGQHRGPSPARALVHGPGSYRIGGSARSRAELICRTGLVQVGPPGVRRRSPR